MFVSHCRRCGRLHPVHEACRPLALRAWIRESVAERQVADHAERAALIRYLRSRRAG